MKRQSTSGVLGIRNKRVLIVAQDLDAAELYAIWLEREGYCASITTDAARALVIAPVLRPHAAIIDVGSPAVDAVQLVRELRELPELERCHYIAVMAYSDSRLHDHCVAAGFGSIFDKPMLRSMLIGSVFAAPLLAPCARFG